MDAVSRAAIDLLDSALDGLVAAREREGEHLRALLLERCDKLLERVAEVRERMPEVLAGIRARLRDRLADVAPDTLSPREALDLIYELKALARTEGR
jgi:uncharacterized protein (TIGR00255 family)